MKQTKSKANVEAAYGKNLVDYAINDSDGKLIRSLPVEFSFDQLEKGKKEDVELARKELKDNDLIQAVNAKRKAKARAEATTTALKAIGINPPDKSDAQVIYRNFVRNFVNGGMAREQAEQYALNSVRTLPGNEGFTPSGEEEDDE
jgi:hypothetical protein